MSQNRMWLVNDQTGQRVLLAKHNAVRWYVFNDELASHLDSVLEFEDSQRRADGMYPAGGSRNWKIEYENDRWPMLPKVPK